MPRRQLVCWRAVIIWGMTALACAPQSLPSPTPASEAAVGALGYRVIHGWPQLPPGELLGPVSGVGLDSRGTVIVFRRAQRTWPVNDSLSIDPIEAPTVLLFDGVSGQQLGAWGEGRFAMPHGLTVDEQDNVWVTDVALHQVFKFTRDGALLLTLGEPGVPGDDSAHFDRPTDVAVAPDGSFYVSDGYRNSRVVRFSKDGRYLSSWGRKGSRPGAFDLPHGIARDATGQVYVADRSNARIQVFDSVGHFLAEWKGPELGRPWAVRAGPMATSTWLMEATSPPPHRTARGSSRFLARGESSNLSGGSATTMASSSGLMQLLWDLTELYTWAMYRPACACRSSRTRRTMFRVS